MTPFCSGPRPARGGPLGPLAGGCLLLGLALPNPGLAETAAAPHSGPAPVNYSTTVIGINEGLPNDVAVNLPQTRDGYLWFGTEDGLCRFDGVRIVTFRTVDNPGLPDNLIRCLLEDKAGTLWVGTQRGLSRYRDGKFQAVGGVSVPVTDLASDAEGRLWIGTLGAGLMEIDSGRLISHLGDPSLPANRLVIRLMHDSADRIWIAFRDSTDNEMATFSKGRFETQAWALEMQGEVARMAESPAGTMWFATSHGVWRRKADGRLQHLGLEQGLPADETTTAFLTDANGRFWIVARQLFRAETPESDAFMPVALEGVNYCRSIIQDREGSYWVGTSGLGVVRLRSSAFRLVFKASGAMRSIAPGEGNIVWAALGFGGIVPIGPNGQLPQVPLGGAEKQDAESLLVDSGGRLWIGSRGPLAMWDGRELHKYPPTDVSCIFQDHTGTLWFGTRVHGIVRYRDGVFESMAGRVGGPAFSTTCLAEDASGTLYVGMDEGLYSVRGGKIEHMDPGGAVPDLEVRAVHPDSEGNLWVGTKRHGLVLYQQGRWYDPKSLSEAIGDTVAAVESDKVGNLWLGTPRGIVWGKKRDFLDVAHGGSETGRFHFSGRDEGAPPSSIGSSVGSGSQPATCRRPDGSIWFVTRMGIVSVQPAGIEINTTVPPVFIERVQVDGITVAAADSVTLPAGTRSVAIDYTAVSFVQPGAVNFRYQLIGHDKDWVDAQNRRAAFYTDLRPGSYRFRVTACNSDGVWNEAGRSLGLEQRPWFYETWWFYGGIGLAVLGAGGGVKPRDNPPPPPGKQGG